MSAWAFGPTPNGMQRGWCMPVAARSMGFFLGLKHARFLVETSYLHAAHHVGRRFGLFRSGASGAG